MVALRSQGNWRWEGHLGTPLGLVHWKRASSPVEAGTGTVIQVYAPASNAEETQIELFYEDLQDISIHGVAKSWTRLSD